MKKIYFSILACAFAVTSQAQLTLTQAFNQPAVGNTNTMKGYDSTAVVPKNTGANQSWNFSSLVTNTNITTSTYTTASSTPSAALFPTATMAEDDGSGQYNYWRTVGSNFELLGFADGAGSSVTFSNSAIAAVWPVTFGYSNTDTYAGTANVSLSGPATGTISTNATGTGTVTLPGSITLSNCLQLKQTNKLVMNLGSFPLSFTITIDQTTYSYYHSSQKFEILNVQYEKQNIASASGPTVTTSATIKVNAAVLSGINEATFDSKFTVYPNPATSQFHVMLDNATNEMVKLEIYNNLGQLIRTDNLGNDKDIVTTVNVSDLQAGVYFVKTFVGDKSVTKKLIIQ